jgi:lipopolysaccharide export system permease protein
MNIILYRYIIKEQLVPLVVCLMGLSFVLITGRLLQLTRYLFNSSLSFVDLFEIIAFAMPKLILYALPMATITGILIAFVRLNSDNELTALRAAGVSFAQFLPPVLCVLTLVSALSFYSTLYLVPTSNNAFETKLKSLGRASLPLILKEGTFIDVIPNLIFFFRSVDPTNLTINGVFVQDHRQADVRMAIVADHAQIVYQKDQNNLTFKISNGIITRVSDNFKDAQAISFKLYDLSLSLDELLGSTGKNSKNKREMSLMELLQMIRKKSDVGYSLEFHQRLAFPLSCLLLGLVGAPLGSLFRQRSRMTGITLGLGVFVAYYILLSAGKGLGENGLLPPFLAVWTPNLLTLVAAIYLWIKTHRETPFAVSSLWKNLGPRLESIRNLRPIAGRHRM